MVLWLGLYTLTEKGPGSIPGQGTKIPQALEYCPHPPKKEKEFYVLVF